MPEITVFDMIVSVGIKIAIRKYWINKQYLKQIKNSRYLWYRLILSHGFIRKEWYYEHSFC